MPTSSIKFAEREQEDRREGSQIPLCIEDIDRPDSPRKPKPEKAPERSDRGSVDIDFKSKKPFEPNIGIFATTSPAGKNHSLRARRNAVPIHRLEKVDNRDLPRRTYS